MRNSQTGTSRLPAAPADLSADAKRLWADITREYSIDDAVGKLLLHEALKSYDRMAQARRIVDKLGLLVKDRFGQARANPAAQVEKDARAGFLSAMKLLGIEYSNLPGGS